ncbi:hypothetical protein JXB12_02915 [candidate division KSB1 bacterium]|nr:hypothetical protein [candidate division KSB1 bacterium]
MKLKLVISIIVLIVIATIITCTMDKGLDITPWIEGEMIIDSIQRVEEGQTGDVVVVVAPDFPPKKWTDIIKTPPLRFDRSAQIDTIEYKVPLNYGNYAVVAVLWKPKGEEWSFETISNILGVYTEPNLFEPKHVDITKADTYVPGIDIFADFAFVRYGAFLKGKITYTGKFAEDTDMVVLASFPMKPETVVDYLFAQGWDLTLPLEASAYEPYEYVLDVNPAYHKYIAVFWKGDRGSPYDFKKLADLKLPDSLPQVGSFVPQGTYVARGDTLTEYKSTDGTMLPLDLVMDFNKIK